MKIPKKLIFVLILFIFKSIGYALFRSVMAVFTGQKHTPKKPVLSKHLNPRDEQVFAQYKIHPLTPQETKGKPIIDGNTPP